MFIFLSLSGHVEIFHYWHRYVGNVLQLFGIFFKLHSIEKLRLPVPQ